jgi:TolB protein
MSSTYRGAKIERSITLFMAVFLLLNLAICGGTTSSPEIQITDDPHDQYSPRISESYIIWVDTRNGNKDIYGFNRETGEEFQITDDPDDQTSPEISGSYVVWQDTRNGNFDIYGCNLETGEESRITWNSSNQMNPDISGTLVVWQDDRDHTNWEIYGCDLSRNEEIRIPENGSDQGSPLVSGDIVVWTEGREGKDSVYGYDISTGREFRVCKKDLPLGIALFDDIVVFQEWPHDDVFISAYSISTGKKTQIEAGGSFSLDMDGSIVVWSELWGCDSGLNGKVLGYDFSSHRLLQISSGNSAKLQPSIYGDFVVWQDSRNGNQDIYGCSLEGVPFRIVHPRPPFEYYYSILSVISILGISFLVGIHPARKIVKTARTAGPHEFRKSLGLVAVLAGGAGFWILYGFFLVHQGSSFGFAYFLPFTPYFASALWHVKIPYVLISQSEITLFEHTLRGPRVITWEEIQSISFGQKGSRIDLQILDDGIVGIRFCELGKKEKVDILRVLQTRFPPLKEPT